jgi:hypothetical protein
MEVRAVVVVVVVRMIVVSVRVRSAPDRRAALLTGGAHFDVARGERAAPYARHAQLMCDAEPGEPSDQLALREARIEQRSEEHVARDAREEIEVKDSLRTRCAVPGRSHARAPLRLLRGHVRPG